MVWDFWVVYVPMFVWMFRFVRVFWFREYIGVLGGVLDCVNGALDGLEVCVLIVDLKVEVQILRQQKAIVWAAQRLVFS